MAQTDGSVSVVIATLGGDTLVRTIDILNAGSLIPDEIIIAIPEDFKSNVLEIAKKPNVIVLETTCKGQVQQRIEGFKTTKCEFVMQLDDDIDVYPDTLKVLMEHMNKSERAIAIAPALVYNDTKQSVYLCNDIDSLSKADSFFHGKDKSFPGKISDVGYSFELRVQEFSETLVPTEWLPGGCVIHRNSNLIIHDYYPFAGKAIEEDVLHSIHLSRNKVELYIAKDCAVGLGRPEYNDYKLNRIDRVNDRVKYLMKQYKTRKLIVSLTSKEFMKYNLYFFIKVAEQFQPGIGRIIRFLLKPLRYFKKNYLVT